MRPEVLAGAKLKQADQLKTQTEILKNRLINVTGTMAAPHYGHGHEDKDTADHFSGFSDVAAQGKGAAAVSQSDRMVNMIDAGDGLISGAVVAPHFGHGHEKEHSRDNFGVGLSMAGECLL